MFQRLIKPSFPRTAVGIERDVLSAVALSRQKNAFAVAQAASLDLPQGVLQPSFNETNVFEPAILIEALQKTALTAGLGRQKNWSVTLPAESARSSILVLESKPASARESQEMLSWKAERSFGTSAGEMRMSFQPLSADSSKRPRYLAVAVRSAVLSEFEDVFAVLRWNVGLILPRHISESHWLTLNNQTAADSLLISEQNEGFAVVLVRGNEPLIVRSIVCEDDEKNDELHRFLLFYRDRIVSENSGKNSLQKMMILGNIFNNNELKEITNETLGYEPPLFRPEEIGIGIPDSEIKFEEIAAPAALASFAFG